MCELERETTTQNNVNHMTSCHKYVDGALEYRYHERSPKRVGNELRERPKNDIKRKTHHCGISRAQNAPTMIAPPGMLIHSE